MADVADDPAHDPGRDVLTIVITQEDGGAPMVKVAGEIDLATADQLRTALLPVLAAGPPCITFHLAGVDFIDSSGLAVLVNSANHTDEVFVREPSPAVLRVIEATGLSDILRTAP